MNRIKELEFKRLIKELEYLNSYLEYKTELVTDVDDKFISNVNKFLDVNPEVKKIFDNKIEERLNKAIENKIESVDSSEKDDLAVVKTEKNPKLKKTFRDIVKKTHPDRTNDIKLNEYYINASKYYKDDNLFKMLSICDNLNIDYEIDDDDSIVLKKEIDNIKNRIKFIESTNTWVWYYTEDDNVKNDIVLNYIKMQII